jgi:hypothetical protein
MFYVGDAVQKCRGYKWPGVIVSVFETLAGERRFVVECTVPEVAGALHIYSQAQLERADPSKP